MASIYDVAQAAGVSPATVSNALNHKKNVSEEVRARVLLACSELGYAPAKKKARTHNSRTVIFNFSDFDRSFYLNIIKGINDYLNENAYELIICTSRSLDTSKKSRLSAGTISLDGKITDEQLLAIAGPDYPIVVMDREINHPYIKSVVVDNFPVMCEMVQQLVAKGYRRFGYIGGWADSLDNRERFRAFTQTLDANGIFFDKKLYFHGDYKEKSGYQAARLMLLAGALPQVVVCANDSMAFGAMRAFKERKLEVPTDIAVTGFDDNETARMMGLTTVAIPRYENGYLAAKELLAMLEEADTGESYRINATIKWRATTK